MKPQPQARVRPAHLALAAILLVALALRVIGSRHGLPVIYNPDEYWHYAWVAINFFETGYDPGYFFNPPAFSYLLHVVFWIALGGGANAQETLSTHPETVFFVARLTVAALGTLGVWLVYLTGARLFDRGVGLIAAAILAVGPLPVYQSHLAVNDVPMLVPVALSLFGSAGVLRKGRASDYVIAGIGLGLAAATKYTAGIVLIPLLAAAIVRLRADGKIAIGRAALGIAVSIGAFFVANPYALFNFSTFWEQFGGLPTTPSEGSRKLGEPETSGIRYYLWTLTWGLGWIPALAALAGAVMLIRRDKRAATLLLPAPILFILFTGSLLRYFGRYLLPVFPMVVLAAAFAMRHAISATIAKAPRARAVVVGIAVAALLGQGLVRSVHSDFVLTRPDTRNAALAWLDENIPAGSRLQVEPTSRNGWFLAPASVYTRDFKMVGLHPVLARIRGLSPAEMPRRAEDEYVADLEPSLIDAYVEQGICWVVSEGSTSGRARAEPKRVPDAVDYYEELAERGEVELRVSPYDEPGRAPPFKFDLVAAYYPFEFHRPGAEMTVYRLTKGSCAG
ncbi:MAG TPA: glycosyltransferase family 39 protein [Actinomycetota bacterium]|nr:glycosyltransferase family 39 protein [Actinomycetota bacterium]